MADAETAAAQVHKYKFNVKMTCAGCSGAVNRALKKAQETNQGEIDDYSVDLATETVLVTGKMPYDDVLEKIKKTGKEVRSGETLE
ncbi:Cytosolic copper metallochaperone [Tulasnella sp. 424]|nr:Cytosolic copper metallochaperone [Tulasnella sp. 424]KAG8968844.1 Cytosolic copper metallochaperone [Tulasnella sp. 425]